MRVLILILALSLNTICRVARGVKKKRKSRVRRSFEKVMCNQGSVLLFALCVYEDF